MLDSGHCARSSRTSSHPPQHQGRPSVSSPTQVQGTGQAAEDGIAVQMVRDPNQACTELLAPFQNWKRR